MKIAGSTICHKKEIPGSINTLKLNLQTQFKKLELTQNFDH